MPTTLAFIEGFHRRGGTVAAVCTGGMIVGAAGLLEGRRATTKREIVPGEARPLDLLAQRYPDVQAIEARVVDAGSVLTGGGVSLGIDMTLHLIARFVGANVAEETARILEYRNAWRANAAALPVSWRARADWPSVQVEQHAKRRQRRGARPPQPRRALRSRRMRN